MLCYAHRISSKLHTSNSFEMRACALPVNVEQIYHVFLHPQGSYIKRLKIAMPIKHCLSCVNALQMHRSNISTGVSALFVPISHQNGNSQL